MTNNRIAILIPTLKKGGAEKQAALLAAALKSDYDVSLIVMQPSGGMEAENLAIADLPSDRLITLSGNILKQSFLLFQYLKKLKINTLFCYLTRPDFVGPVLGRFAGVKFIYQGLRNAELPKAKLLLEQLGNEWSTGAIVNNYAGVPLFKKAGLRHLSVIPNCYPNPQPERIRNNNSDKITVITVGRFVPQKDYPTAISAMATAMSSNPKLRFKIIGHGELQQQVEQWVAQSGFSNRFDILINPHNIMQHLLDADIYLSTSLFEGTSNSIMEAMDASLPVIATRVGDNDRLINDNENGFLTNPGDIKTIADKILTLAYNADLRNRMGVAGNRKLKSEFSTEAFKSHYLSLLSHQE